MPEILAEGSVVFDNIILMTDSYKMTHWRMYPPDTSSIYSYLEARSGGEFPEVVFFGLQYLLRRYCEGVRVDRARIDEAQKFCRSHFGQDLFNLEGWEHIARAWGGKLPVEIKAVPEGRSIPEGQVLLTIENTDSQCPWLTNHLETLLVQLWYPCTVATISREQRKILLAGLEKSGHPDQIDFKLHDFGYRGSTTVESAGLGGAAHLVNFKGTDTLAACELLAKYYDSPMAGFSVPASEHSTITAWGEKGEKEAFAHILDEYPTGLVSVVSDSWDIHRACRKLWGEYLKNKVRERKGVLVVRPDSGSPEKIVPECLDALSENFGHSTNAKGFKVLPDYIRLIQGDGITRHSLGGIVQAILAAGYSLDNVVFGSGGGLLQDVNRDTQRFALKCSHAVVEGKGRDVFKRPASDPTKNSKRGRLKLVWAPGSASYKTVPEQDPGRDELVRVFKNGVLEGNLSLEKIRENAKI